MAKFWSAAAELRMGFAQAPCKSGPIAVGPLGFAVVAPKQVLPILIDFDLLDWKGGFSRSGPGIGARLSHAGTVVGSTVWPLLAAASPHTKHAFGGRRQQQAMPTILHLLCLRAGTSTVRISGPAPGWGVVAVAWHAAAAAGGGAGGGRRFIFVRFCSIASLNYMLGNSKSTVVQFHLIYKPAERRFRRASQRHGPGFSKTSPQKCVRRF